MLLLWVSEGRLQENSVMQRDFNNSRVFQREVYCYTVLLLYSTG